ncbi:MAG: YbhB/YbcL family Raf kinase inhibitor-like protein [Candidatus Omnitrophica bacterium]|nr:YbhB/YbcL family Raf kinase inhibitor-like protein [Candidatus Omnitrophota bacterium]
MAMELGSPAFENKGVIPKLFSCEGKDVSPALEWRGAPVGAKSFAVICDDPDAPMGTWVHWVIYNIPAGKQGMSEGVSRTAMLDDGSKQGFTDFQRPGYGGPCPPPGRPHRYFFKLYALDTKLDIKAKVTKEVLLEAMEGHILAEAVLVGTYQR